MTKPNVLVLDGSEVKLRLEAERTAHKSMVHIDWVRFTCFLRNVVPDFNPKPGLRLPAYQSDAYYHDVSGATQDLVIRSVLDSFKAEHTETKFKNAMHQALQVAQDICKALGPEFTICPEIKNGQDFYKYRWCIERHGHECAWVGFLASSSSPRQQSQDNSIHANIQGHACTFAEPGWNLRLAKVVELHEAKITRTDLALDFFEGLGYDIRELETQYTNGAFDVRGRRPKCKQNGNWWTEQASERSLYIGCKKSGKETNVYEKGDQLFGPEADSPWVRAELRYGNKLRVLPVDILRHPEDYFAGASDWHAAQLRQLEAVATAKTIPQEKKLAAQSVTAEVHRNIRWAMTSASQTIATAFRFLSESEFIELCDWRTKKLPGRLRRFSDKDLSGAFSRVMGSFSQSGSYPRLSHGLNLGRY